MKVLIDALIPGYCPYWSKCSSYKRASELCKQTIDEHNLGSSQWAGGKIMHRGKIIADVSYNGRVFKGDKCIYCP